jgi:hypothetical protein
VSISITLPSGTVGVPYNECITLQGTGPFSVLDNNLGDSGTIDIVGSSLCIKIPNPKGSLDVSIEIIGGCSGCASETLVGSIAVGSGECACVPLSIADQEYLNPVVGQFYQAAIKVSGTVPIEICGASLPRCLNAEIVGNILTISGNYEKDARIIVSLKNACTCDCLVWEHPCAGPVRLGGNFSGSDILGCTPGQFPLGRFAKIGPSCPNAGYEPIFSCVGELLGYLKKTQDIQFSEPVSVDCGAGPVVLYAARAQ